MKNIGKRILSIVLCLAILASATVMSVYATESGTEKQNLIDAWENLKMKECTVLVQGQTPIAELPEDLGVTNTEKALLGSHFTKIDSDIADNWSNVSKSVTARINSQTVASLGFESVSFSVYSEVSQAELHYALSFEQGGDNNYPNSWNLVSKGFSTVDMSALMEGDKTITTATLKRDYSAQVGSVYVGSIVGYKTVDIEVPAEVYTMSDEELYEAAVALDLSLCSDGVEEFNSALIALNKALNPEAAALIEAWGNLVKEEYITIAYPGGAKQGSPTLGESSSLTGLTDEQKVKLGSHYWQMNSKTDTVWGINWENNENLSQYDSVFYVVYGTAGAVCTKINGGADVYTSANAFTTVDVTPSSNWWSLEHWSYDWYAPIYIGSVVGHKTVKATVPEDILGISLRQLYFESAKIDVTDYTLGAEEFVAARNTFYNWLEVNGLLDAKKIATDNLLSAWENIADDSKIVKDIIAVPDSKLRIKVDENTVIDDLNDTTVLGGYYADKYKWSDGTALGWNSSISHSFVTSGFNFSEYKEVYFYLSAYDVNGNPTQVRIVTQLNGAYDDGATGTGWFKIPFNRYDENAHYIKFLCLEGNLAYVSYGSIIGEKIVQGTALPTDYKQLSLEQLVDLASNVDTEGFESSSEFDAALKEAKSAIGALDVNISNTNGVITGKPDSFYYSDKINLLAKANGGYRFDGWYSGEQLICESKDYSFVVKAPTDIVAKFIAIKGDVTLDNKVNSSDLVGLRKVLFNDTDSTEHADINDDTFVDIIDLVKLKKKLMNELDESNYITVDSEAFSGDENEITDFKLLTNRPKAFDLVEFSLQTPNLSDELNVYLEDDVDITMTLSDPQGESLVVDAFYFEEYEINQDRRLINIATGENSFRIRVNPKSSGVYSFEVTLAVKGEIIDRLNGYINIADNDEGSDLLEIEPNNKRTFITASGEDYVAIGENVCWNTPNENSFEFGKYITEQMDVLSQNGGNYVRIWDYVYTGGRIKSAVNRMNQTASAMWDQIFESAEQTGVYISFVLLNHGELSQTNADASFNDTCWYAGNGGYITDASDFYTDAQTIAALKTYIRYIVSRWGYSENLMTWEICNELDHAVDDKGGAVSEIEVKTWINTVADYLREQDPYDHMVSNSPGRYDSPYAGLDTFDFIYYHMYDYASWGANIQLAINFIKNAQAKWDRPVLLGEWGLSQELANEYGYIQENLIHFHHGNWISLMGGGAGTAMFWNWHELYEIGGHRGYNVISTVAKEIPWQDSNISLVDSNDSGTDFTNYNYKIDAVGYRGNDYAYIWFYDNKYLVDNQVETVFNNKASFKMGNGTYSLNWIDTKTGECLKEEIVTVSSGRLTATMPSWSKDVLLTVKTN